MGINSMFSITAGIQGLGAFVSLISHILIAGIQGLEMDVLIRIVDMDFNVMF